MQKSKSVIANKVKQSNLAHLSCTFWIAAPLRASRRRTFRIAESLRALR